jgi:ribosomal protein S13
MSTLTLDKQSVERINADMNEKVEMLSDEQVNAIAEMVNNAVNLPLLGEKTEFVVFAKIVRMLDSKLYELLPNEYYELINDASNGITEEEAAKMEERLTKLLNEKVNIPFISERKEEILIGIVIGQIIRAMVKGFKLSEKPIA